MTEDNDYGPAPKDHNAFMLSFDVLKLFRAYQRWRDRNLFSYQPEENHKLIGVEQLYSNTTTSFKEIHMNKVLQILALLPGLVACIKAVEEMLPISGAGKEKMEIVKSLLTAVYEATSELWPVLEKLVPIFVSAANRMGIFKTTTAPTIAPVEIKQG